LARGPGRIHRTESHVPLQAGPCDPQRGRGGPVSLQALACDADGATFAVLFADADPGSAGAFLDHWRAATLAGLHSNAEQEIRAFRPSGALGLSQSLQVTATGKRADGRPVQGRAAYFARGRQVFQAVVYAEALRPEFTNPFFSGLAFE
jgi:hypothetical protein